MYSGRGYIKFDMIRACEKAIDGLGRQRPSSVKAAMDSFAKEWGENRGQAFYAARYNFKQVATNKACGKHGRVFQVKLRRDYRALLIFLEKENKAIWLDVFVKNPSDQNRHIKAACERAIRLRNRSHDER